MREFVSRVISIVYAWYYGQPDPACALVDLQGKILDWAREVLLLDDPIVREKMAVDDSVRLQVRHLFEEGRAFYVEVMQSQTNKTITDSFYAKIEIADNMKGGASVRLEPFVFVLTGVGKSTMLLSFLKMCGSLEG